MTLAVGLRKYQIPRDGDGRWPRVSHFRHPHARASRAPNPARSRPPVPAAAEPSRPSYRVAVDNSPIAKFRRVCGVLSPTFPAGGMVLFIPWRVVAEESGAAHLGFRGAMLLDPPRADGEAGGGAADFHFSDMPVRGDDGARAIGANEPRGRRRQHP